MEAISNRLYYTLIFHFVNYFFKNLEKKFFFVYYVIINSRKGALSMNSKQLEYAIELSKSLNFSHVAKKLGISQPALSKQISILESKLGILLFDRSKNPIEVTPAGKYFFSEAQDLLYREEQLYRTMGSYASGNQGELKIGASPFRAMYLLPHICKKIKEKFPGTNIIVHDRDSEILRRKASEGKYDFVIVNMPVDETLFDVYPIEQDVIVLVVPESMVNLIDNPPQNTMSEIDFNSCEKLPFIAVDEKLEMRQIFRKMCVSADINPHITMEVIGLTTAWSMAKEGIGATLLPLQFVKSVILDGNIRMFVPKNTANMRQPAIIMRKGQYVSPCTKYAIELLTTYNSTDK